MPRRQKKKRPIGRPRKYIELVRYLIDDEIYSAASIVRWKQEHYLFDRLKGAEKKEALRRARHSLAAQSKHLSEEGDGMVKLKGQPRVAGWFGWRWKTLLPEKWR